MEGQHRDLQEVRLYKSQDRVTEQKKGTNVWGLDKVTQRVDFAIGQESDLNSAANRIALQAVKGRLRALESAPPAREELKNRVSAVLDTNERVSIR